MRLLDTTTLLLREFPSDPPPYAILSHTWGEEEVVFEEIEQDEAVEKQGYDKIRGCCAQAKAAGLRFAWVDTCCIDKRSSAELSEAINSMFSWYSNAHLCYAYLADVDIGASNSWEKQLTHSRWFRRGWTLQELLAPSHVIFFDKNWCEIGTKASLLAQLARITKISHQAVMDPRSIWQTSIAERMSWAAGRETTRIEDMAYSLLGIFKVNMPLLYGEGTEAFRRLQLRVLESSHDHSILAWRARSMWNVSGKAFGVLASTPAEFARPDDDFSSQLTSDNRELPLSTISPTNLGLSITLPIIRLDGVSVAILNCQYRGKLVGIYVTPEPHSSRYSRSRLKKLHFVDRRNITLADPERIFLSTVERVMDPLDPGADIKLSVTSKVTIRMRYNFIYLCKFHNRTIKREVLPDVVLMPYIEEDSIVSDSYWVALLLRNGLGDTFGMALGLRDGRIWSQGFEGCRTEDFALSAIRVWDKFQEHLSRPADSWSYFHDRGAYSMNGSVSLSVAIEKGIGKSYPSRIPLYKVSLAQVSRGQQ